MLSLCAIPYGFQEPEFQCANVRDMIRHLNQLGQELAQEGNAVPPVPAHTKPKKSKRKETER